MEKYIEVLKSANMFSGIEDEINGLLECVQAKRVKYAKGELIIEEGGEMSEFGILLSGHARSVKLDASGRLIILVLHEKGNEVGVLLAASPGQKSPVSVQAQDDTEVLMIPYRNLITRCEKACPRHEKLLLNYIHVVAQKGLELHGRINCLLQPSVRDKVITFLQRVSYERKSRVFSIPLDRKAMAEYLNVDRSVLSNELSKMRHEGMLEYNKNNFKLL